LVSKAAVTLGHHRKLAVVVLILILAILLSLEYLEDIAEVGDTQGTQSLISFAASLQSGAIDFASSAGYGGIFILMLLEAAALPVPSEIILPFSGYLVWKGTLSFWPTVLVSVVAALIGSFIDYYIGWIIGEPLLTSKKIPFVSSDHLQRIHMWFNRYGTWAVALFRLIPAARVLISFPAGAYRMNRAKFAIYTALGCLTWNFILVYLGWWLGASWSKVVEAFRYVDLIAYALLILLSTYVCWILASKSQWFQRACNHRDLR
jgi:membrane protein DedA with SNARE-associated domain